MEQTYYIKPELREHMLVATLAAIKQIARVRGTKEGYDLAASLFTIVMKLAFTAHVNSFPRGTVTDAVYYNLFLNAASMVYRESHKNAIEFSETWKYGYGRPIVVEDSLVRSILDAQHASYKTSSRNYVTTVRGLWAIIAWASVMASEDNLTFIEGSESHRDDEFLLQLWDTMPDFFGNSHDLLETLRNFSYTDFFSTDDRMTHTFKLTSWYLHGTSITIQALATFAANVLYAMLNRKVNLAIDKSSTEE